MRQKTKKFISLFLSLALVLGLSSATMTGCSKKTAEKPERVYNRLNGDEKDTAEGERSVAIVVENTAAARPQWGINDEEYSPDIILQGEVEGGITRMLWFYSDMTKIPEQVGPLRSARPPFIKFSELFDSVFIHWGQSHTSEGYIGANTVFRKDKVDHINQMSFDDEVGLYGRDTSRGVSSEHTGYLVGSKVKDAISACDFSDKSDYKGLTFAAKTGDMGKDTCGSLNLKWSDRTESIDWKYNEDDNKYHSSNFDTDVARDNLIVLYDETEYQTKSNYQGAGGAVTYCDYKLNGGKGYVISNGTKCEITWAVEDGNLVLRHLLTEKQKEEQKAREKEAKENDEEAVPVLGKVVKLNPGKSWIGWISDNNGGKISTTSYEKKAEAEDKADKSDAE